MVLRLRRWGERLFPERQILVRTEGRISCITLTCRAQMTAAAALLLGIGSLAYFAVGYVQFERAVAAKQAEVLRAQVSNADLRLLVTDMQDQLARANAEIDGTQSRLAAIGNQYGSLQGSLTSTEQQLNDLVATRDRLLAEREMLQRSLEEAQANAEVKTDYAQQLATNLERNKSELVQTETQRAELAAKLHQLEKELQVASARAAEFKTTLESTERKLQQVAGEREKLTAERERLAAERDLLRQKLREAEARLAKGEMSTGANTVPETKAPAPAPAPTESSAGSVGGDVEKLLAATGVDVDALLAQLGGAPKGEGGPYIALNGPKAAGEDQIKRDAVMRTLLKSLPLAAPLAHYQLESPFGARVDPINKRRGFHPGVDLAAPFRSPVYSTGPGVVTYAGNKEKYGKFVEIDHGNGIVTHYAHLHRITVVRGQKVGTHQQIGELGSTGRSTGPHVHYEVVVNGEPVDPEKFMELGKNVVQVKQ